MPTATDLQVPISLVYENATSVKAGGVPFTEGRDIWWNDVIPQQSTECQIEWMDAEDPLFLLYTSGSTGGFSSQQIQDLRVFFQQS